MKPVEQTIPGPPHGDCFRACVASILELPIEHLPNPHHPEFHWWDAWNEWLQDRGFNLVEWDVPKGGERPDGLGVWCPLDGFWIATVPSLNVEPDPERPATGRHCIVMEGQRIAHDPSTAKKRTGWEDGDRVFSATVILPLNPVVPAPAPHVTEEERELLEEIAEGLDIMAHANEIRGKEIAIAGNQREAASFLRNLAQRLSSASGEGRPVPSQKLTKPQLRLLRSLCKAPFGVSLGGKWIGTGRALVARGLAEGSRSHITITDAGREFVAATPSTSGGQGV